MSLSSDFENLRAFAMTLPEAEEGTSCNKSSFKARKKGYCYLGLKDDSLNLMVKLDSSLPEAEMLEKKQPDCFDVGSGGWVKAEFQSNQKLPIKVLKEWIKESFRLLAHKELVAQLDENGSTNPGKNRLANRVAGKQVAKSKTPIKKKK